MKQKKNYRVVLSKVAEKNLKKIDIRFLPRIIKAIDLLSRNPHHAKPLTGPLSGLYSLRVWPYRVIYCIKENECVILVLAIGHRQNIYK